MHDIYKLKNTIQEYAWGSRTAIPELSGEKSPSENPQAELWMGAHPKAPSLVEVEGSLVSLNYFIKRHPDGILGEKVAQRFNNQLPFLFKVIAAEKPLSIQAHPNREQAIDGFKRENSLEIPLDSPNRNYRDENHKPEIICALTNFWALNGFRKIVEIIELADMLRGEELEREIDTMKKQPNSSGLKIFFESLMMIPDERKKSIVKIMVEKSSKLENQNIIFKWICRLHDEYPADIGILAPVYLNLIELKPGEAMFLDAGDLHAYLEGVGIELMANSDNVLRGGLTPKHVDVPELMKIVNFREKKLELIDPADTVSCERVYVTPAEEFELSVIELKKGSEYSSDLYHGIEIMIVVDGEALIRDIHRGNAIELPKGSSILVPSIATDYRMTGRAVIYKAGIPKI